MKKYLPCIILISYLLLTAACDVQEKGDGGFISGTPCGPPCINGIVPGVTTKTQLLAVLDEMHLLKACETSITDDNQHQIFDCPRLYIVLSSKSNYVTSVNYSQENDISLQEVISKFGDPDAVKVDEELCCPENVSNAMVLYYDDYQMILLLPIKPGFTYITFPSDTIQKIIYYDSESYEFIKTRSSDEFMKWEGFGIYNLTQ